MGALLGLWRAEIEAIAASVPPSVAEAFRLLLDTSPEPTSRRQMEPGHLTASAFVLSPDGSSVLLVDHVALGLWLQPGGHVDEGDTSAVAAAAREALEETGLRVEHGALLDLDVHAIPARPSRGEGAHRHFDVRVGFRATGWDIRAGDAGVRGARWVTWDALDGIATDDSVRRTAAKLRGWGLSAGRLHPPA